MTTAKKQKAFVKGTKAEGLAALYLRLKGYRVLKRRYKKPVGEIDLIVKKGRRIVFVEVKARANQTRAIESITPHQQKRINRAAQIFLQEHPAFNSCDTRFDVVLISPFSWPQHIPSAWLVS